MRKGDTEYERAIFAALDHVRAAHRLIVDAQIERNGIVMGGMHSVCVQLREMVIVDLPREIDGTRAEAERCSLAACDPIECGFEAAFGQAEEMIRHLRAALHKARPYFNNPTSDAALDVGEEIDMALALPAGSPDED